MNSNAERHPSIPAAVVQAAISRLEEKCAVITAMEVAWQAPSVSDDIKLLVLVDVRRTLVDVIVGLEGAALPQ